MTKGYVFDLDGTIYLEDEAIEGAINTLNHLKDKGDKIVFLTNKSIARRSDYVTKLSQMGFNCSIDQVINSNYITAKFLNDELINDQAAFVIGEVPLFDELTQAGVNITNDPIDASVVVIGWDRKFDYNKLDQAYQAFLNGAKLVATNPDRSCPIKGGGMIPDCGAMIGAIEGVIGKTVDFIAGKPSAMMAQYVIQDVLKLLPEDCFMVGDRLETDILMGNENNMNSALVLTGITDYELLQKSSIQPKYVLNSVVDLLNIEE
ncbi:HAD-IIA family hydrolase [Tenuibacillus multivorans]|uniref:Acid sugar phosphatase n=1 Tax=Tenuibacillus multivorans TaxID=237069 RepID=A0A1H0BX19_9BACI|nr:HAD-IIA family hydrolase [Tenuibacillus multivorans]GEL78554.1 haloacid dehalogenase [Tenuibacillus multivorans]SDN50143.1 arabinose operon protein AraL [Tenuibacillus multivorans]